MASTSRNVPRASGGLFLRLAWRNLWRNTRRTLIACASIFFAVFLSVLVSSTQEGQNDMLIDASVGFSTGHVQVHGRGYWEKRSLDKSMVLDSVLLSRAEALPHVIDVVPRFETISLVARGSVTKVTPVLGIDRVREQAMTKLANRIIRGDTLAAWNSGAILASGLARFLGAGIGDTIVLFGQGYQGVTAAALVRVAAIAEFPIPDINNALLYLPLGEAQEIFASTGRLTSLAVLADDDDNVESIAAGLRSLAGPECEVMTWRELLPELVQAVSANNGGTVLMLLILYVVIGFGIFGTVVMMTSERKKEFGMVIALGMRRWRLTTITTVETILIALVGSGAGIAASIPVVLYLALSPIQLGGDYASAMLAYGLEPIIPFSTDPVVFLAQALIVATLGVASALYPALVIHTLSPVRAMRG